MRTDLGPLTIARKTGGEQFKIGGGKLDFDLLSFWQWAYSDLVGNTLRGAVAEYLVAHALGLAHDGVRNDWAAFDLLTESGLKIEVKSSAYVQTWYQPDYSQVQFGITPTRAWNPLNNVIAKESKRHSDLYVFALLAHLEKASIDPMDVDQWQFYVLPTLTLDTGHRGRSTIRLEAIEKQCPPIQYVDLRLKVEEAGTKLRFPAKN